MPMSPKTTPKAPKHIAALAAVLAGEAGDGFMGGGQCWAGPFVSKLFRIKLCK